MIERKEERKNLNERIKTLRKKVLNLTQEEFANRISSAQTTIAGYENGSREPSNIVISSICREFGVNEIWLRTGEGEMFQQMDQTEKIVRWASKITTDVPNRDIKLKLVELLSELDESVWEGIMDAAKKILKEPD